MRAEHRNSALFDYVADGGEAGIDSTGVGDLAVGERHVEVAAQQHVLAGEFELVDRCYRHGPQPRLLPGAAPSPSNHPRATPARTQGARGKPVGGIASGLRAAALDGRCRIDPHPARSASPLSPARKSGAELAKTRILSRPWQPTVTI